MTMLMWAGAGVYVFPCLTILGYDKDDSLIQKLMKIGFRLSDSNSRCEGLELKNVSPFYLMRLLAREFGFDPVKVMMLSKDDDTIALAPQVLQSYRKHH